MTVRAPNAPVAQIAYRDGDGPWTTAKGADTPLSIAIETGRYTVIIGCPTADGVFAGVSYEMTLAELDTIDHDAPCVDSSITISGPPGGQLEVAFGTVGSYPNGTWPGGVYTLPVPPGTHDLAAGLGSIVHTRLYLLRDLAVTTSVVQPIDINGPGSFALERPAVVGASNTESSLITAGGTAITLGLQQDGHIVAPPASEMRPGDLLAITLRSGGGAVANRRTYVTPDRPATLSYPMALQPAASGGARRSGMWTIVGASWQAQPSATVYELEIEFGVWRAYVSPGVFAEDLVVEMPDVSQVPGWEAYRYTLNAAVHWNLSAMSGLSISELVRLVPPRAGIIDRVGYAGNAQVQ